MERILTTCYSLEGDGLPVLLASRKLQGLLDWGSNVGESQDDLPNVAALLRSKTKLDVGTKVYELFSDLNPPKWFKGEIVAPRRQGMFTVRYEDSTKIDQEEREVRQWLDVRETPSWQQMTQAVRSSILYLRNRLEGNLPPGQKHYDCSRMFTVMKALRYFDPSYAAQQLTPEGLDALTMVKPVAALVPDLRKEMHAYVNAAKEVHVDHTENANDHSFTNQVLQFFRSHAGSDDFPTWVAAARIVFAFTPNSAAAERVFSLLKSMFGDDQERALGDMLQAAIMLRYNKRS
mmetsp:Transcript_38051/g.87092  ORF Transcript_38051/g.87092 Transcript_38051/m.87092 type:complete len:290 (-) Transcript_38051:97-966(-)